MPCCTWLCRSGKQPLRAGASARAASEERPAAEGESGGAKKWLGISYPPGRQEWHAVHYPDLPPLTEARLANWPDVYHPLLRTHPETGRKALYIGRWACDIEGLPEAEGRALIAELQAFATQPQFVYRHQWQLHDGLLWDNRCLLHCATGFDDSRYERHMHRTTLEGDTPYYRDGQRVIRSAIASRP